MIVRPQSLRRAVRRVRREMVSLGLWHPDLDRVQVRQDWVAIAHGYQWFGDRSDGRIAGDVVIPRLSFARLWETIARRKRTALADVIRHEFAHAYADLHQGWIRSKAFATAFGMPHNSTWKATYDSKQHVSRYAATCPCEDFAETFTAYTRHRAKIPTRFDQEAIRRKWHFIAQLAE